MLRYAIAFVVFFLLGFGARKAFHVPFLKAVWVLPAWLAVISVGYLVIGRALAANPVYIWLGLNGGHWLAFALGLFPLQPASAAQRSQGAPDGKG